MSTNSDPGNAWFSRAHFFLTVDAETEVIAEGIRTISLLRERVERKGSVEIPIVWFVRFQRTWDEYVTIDAPEYFAGPVRKAFDGFELAKAELRRLRERGDEVGWHYHAYSYVHREDLGHERRIAILKADLAVCAAEIRSRHPEFAIRSLRFGWFFIPDYEVFTTLKSVGIEVDASVRPDLAGKQVAIFNARYLPPITLSPRKVNGVWFVPYVRTRLVHDFNVVAHDLGWTSQDERQAARRREEFEADLAAVASSLREAGGVFLTYERILRTVGGRPED